MAGCQHSLLWISRPSFGSDVYAVVQKKKPTAGSLDRALLVVWFDRLAVILARGELDEIWPQELLDAYIALIPKVDGDATPGWSAASMCTLSDEIIT